MSEQVVSEMAGLVARKVEEEEEVTSDDNEEKASPVDHEEAKAKNKNKAFVDDDDAKDTSNNMKVAVLASSNKGARTKRVRAGPSSVDTSSDYKGTNTKRRKKEGWMSWLWRGPPPPNAPQTTGPQTTTQAGIPRHAHGHHHGVVGRARTFVGDNLGAPPTTVTNYLWYPVAIVQYVLTCVPGVAQNTPMYRINDLAAFLVVLFLLWSLYSHGLQLVAMVIAICLPLQRVFQAIKTENVAELIRWCHYFILVGVGMTLLDDLLLLWFDHLWVLPAIQIALCWSFCHTQVLTSASYQTVYFWFMTKLEKVTDEASRIVAQGPVPVMRQPNTAASSAVALSVGEQMVLASSVSQPDNRLRNDIAEHKTAPSVGGAEAVRKAMKDNELRMQTLLDQHKQMMASTFNSHQDPSSYMRGGVGAAAAGAARPSSMYSSARGRQSRTTTSSRLPPVRTPFEHVGGAPFGTQAFDPARGKPNGTSPMPSFLRDLMANNDINNVATALPTEQQQPQPGLGGSSAAVELAVAPAQPTAIALLSKEDTVD